jgi:hypothetical protein
MLTMKSKALRVPSLALNNHGMLPPAGIVP